MLDDEFEVIEGGLLKVRHMLASRAPASEYEAGVYATATLGLLLGAATAYGLVAPHIPESIAFDGIRGAALLSTGIVGVVGDNFLKKKRPVQPDVQIEVKGSETLVDIKVSGKPIPREASTEAGESSFAKMVRPAVAPAKEPVYDPACLVDPASIVPRTKTSFPLAEEGWIESVVEDHKGFLTIVYGSADGQVTVCLTDEEAREHAALITELVNRRKRGRLQ